MTAPVARMSAAVLACSLDELRQRERKVVSLGGRTVLVVLHDGQVYALDNRCPHMGFPLSRGTVRDGILVCHWHHARFDLAGGCTFDPFADDVASFPVEVRDGQVWVDPSPREDDRREHWERKLDEGLKQDIRLVLAKSVIGLAELDAIGPVLEKAALFGVRNRASGWSTGLSILTAMANVLPVLSEADRPRALYQGIIHVASSTAGQPPSFALEPLTTTERRPEVFRNWLRRFIEVRSSDGAERALRTAIDAGAGDQPVADMLLAACTDHLYIDEGHALDFTNKAFELLDHIGWEHADDVLPSVVPVIADAQRMEETSSWRYPIDLAALLRDADEQLDAALAEGGERSRDWRGHRALAETVLDAEPDRTVAALLDAVRAGVPLVELTATVAYAAARRAVHFHTSNEFGDWNTVHHVFTYANSVDRAMRRAPSRELARAIFDGAMAVYLERFLNVPKQPLPKALEAPPSAVPTRDDLLAEFDRQQRVDETADIAAAMLAAGRQQEVVATLGHALVREDAGFHQFQIYEAAVQQARNFAGRAEADHIILAAARFLTAHSPTVRSVEQTYDIAARLHRGESLHGEEAEPADVAQ